MRIDYNIKDKFDFGLFLPALILFGFGLLAIYSSTINNAAAHENFQKQVIWGVVALILFFITYSLPTNFFKSIAVPSYLVSLFLLLAFLSTACLPFTKNEVMNDWKNEFLLSARMFQDQRAG